MTEYEYWDEVAEAPTMSLGQLAEEYLTDIGDASRPFTIRSTPVFDKLADLTRSEERAESTLASTFWQVYTLSTDFESALRYAGVPYPILRPAPEIMVVAHGPMDRVRYDLVILLPDYPPEEPPKTIPVPRFSGFGLEEALAEWRSLRLNERSELRGTYSALPKPSETMRSALETSSQLLDIMTEPALDELTEVMPFGILIMRKPRTEQMHVPQPCWGISPHNSSEPTSTAGIALEDSEGRFGVTGALHAMLSYEGDRLELGSWVHVNGRPGRICNAHSVSDSCFIELESRVDITDPYGLRPPLSVCPRPKEKVVFEGITTRKGQTHVISSSLEVPGFSPLTQYKVYTDPATSPGDSGAALIDGDGNIIGFCFERTGIGEPGGYSSWIWAQSVYVALQLQTYR